MLLKISVMSVNCLKYMIVFTEELWRRVLFRNEKKKGNKTVQWTDENVETSFKLFVILCLNWHTLSVRFYLVTYSIYKLKWANVYIDCEINFKIFSQK